MWERRERERDRSEKLNKYSRITLDSGAKCENEKKQEAQCGKAALNSVNSVYSVYSVSESAQH